MKKLNVIFCGVALMAMASVAQGAPKPAPPQVDQYHWEKLGERVVDAKLDKDVITVGRDDGFFNAIQIKVEGSAIVLFEVKVIFGDGQKVEPDTRLVFNKDSQSRVIDLPGNRRAIKRVEFKYQDLPGGGKAKVELLGGVTYHWEKLGERIVDAKLDRDVITVGRKDGAFTALRIEVDGSAIALFEIKVIFVDGQKFEPNTRLVFNKDTHSRIIDLPGNRRIIKQVEFKYQDLPGGGKAKVELLGANAPGRP